MEMEIAVAATVAGAFVLGGLVKGVIGLGLPTVSIGIMGLVLPPVEAAAILIVPSLATNIWQALVGANFFALMRRLGPMLIGICAGSIGSALIGIRPDAAATAGLGAAIFLYSLIGLSPLKLHVPPRAEWWAGPLAGLGTGIITAATGVFVLPSGPYVQALGLARDDLVQGLGLCFTVSTIALAAALAIMGAMPANLTGISAVAVVPAVAGMLLGQVVRHRVRPAAFRIWFFVGLMLLGAHLMLRSVF